MAVAPPRGENSPMDDRNRMKSLHIGAAAVTWAIVTGVTLYVVLREDSTPGGLPAFVVLAILNLAATLYAVSTAAPLRYRQVIHAAGLACALGTGLVLPVAFFPIYTIVWIGVASRLYPKRPLWFLLFGITFAWYLIMRFSWGEAQAAILIFH